MSKRRPLNIAMVVASPFPANHGTPGSIREMTEALAAQGHCIHVVTYHFGAGNLPKDVQIHRVIDLGFRRHMVVGPTWQKPILDFCMVFALLRVIQRERIDLIHAHNYEGALIGYLARVLARKPLIYHAVNTMCDELTTYNFIRPTILAAWLARFLDYWVPRTADRIVAISEELVHFLHSRGIKAERIRLIPLGIDGTPFHESNGSVIRQQYDMVEKPLVMYTGILDRLQRIDYLLKAMRIVVAQIVDARLLLLVNLAKERDLRVCQMMIERFGLEKYVVIVTHTSFAELPLFLAAADVTVVCRPHCPGFPVKLLNYMAAGKPIVIFEGSAKGLRHNHNAFVVQDHNWHGLGEGIVNLLHDRVLAETLGHHAQQWVRERFSWSRLVKKIECVYDEVL